jgi:hypothetical protein
MNENFPHCDYCYGAHEIEKCPRIEATAGRLPARACSPLLVLPKDACNNESLAELKDAGYIVIRTDSPQNVRLVTPEMAVDHSDMVMASLKALCESNANIERFVFVRELNRRLLIREANAKSPSTP